MNTVDILHRLVKQVENTRESHSVDCRFREALEIDDCVCVISEARGILERERVEGGGDASIKSYMEDSIQRAKRGEEISR